MSYMKLDLKQIGYDEFESEVKFEVEGRINIDSDVGKQTERIQICCHIDNKEFESTISLL